MQNNQETRRKKNNQSDAVLWETMNRTRILLWWWLTLWCQLAVDAKFAEFLYSILISRNNIR